MSERLAMERLRAVVTRLHRLLRRSQPALSPAQETLLTQLNTEGPQTVGQLASRQQVSAATISRMLVTLERKALVRRARDKRDRRVVYVIVTREGSTAASRQEKGRAPDWLGSLSEEDVRIVNRALAVLDQAEIGAQEPKSAELHKLDQKKPASEGEAGR
ncbi:MAG: MarR family transcriptional regulator [Pseudomonadota bacterium]